MTVCRTAKELIEALSALPDDTVVFASEPPFTGVKLVPQGSGSLFVASLRDTEEGRVYQDGKMKPLN